MLKKAYLLGAQLAVKTAASYLATGDVQGVGLRKALHAMLDERGAEGIAVNNPYTGNVEIQLPQEHADILEALGDKLDPDAKSYSIQKLDDEDRLRHVDLDDALLRRFMLRQGFTENIKKPVERQKDWVRERYRLADVDGHLVGDVPELAYRQLRGLEPVYARAVTDTTNGPPLAESPWMRRAWERHIKAES